MKIQKNIICIILIVCVIAIELLVIFFGNSLFISKKFVPSIWQISYFIILAVSLNLIYRQMGQLSLGHCGFMAIGAYTAALLSLGIERKICKYNLYVTNQIAADTYNATVKDYRETTVYIIIVLLSIGIGAMLAAAAGFLCALPSAKMKGDYLAVITLGFGMVIVNVINNLPFAGGDGLQYGNSSSALYKNGLGFSNKLLCQYIWIAIAITVLAILVTYLYADSRFGRNIRAIREDEIASVACGIDVRENKITTFVISSFLAGAAGGIYACCTKSISTVDFAFSNSGILNSVFIVVIVILGGDSVFGSAVSATLLYCVNYLIKQSGLQNSPGIIGAFFGYPMLCYAILLIVVVMVKGNKKSKESLMCKINRVLQKGGNTVE